MTEEVNKTEEVNQAIQQESYPRQSVAGPEFDARGSFSMSIEIFVWEEMTARSLTNKLKNLEESELQIRTTMDRIEANGGRGNQEWKHLEVRYGEVTRLFEHTKKTVKPGDLVLKGKQPGMIDVHVGVDWNRSLVRHVVVNELGIVIRTLVRAPISG